MADPDGTHHIVRLSLEIDGRRYSQEIEPLLATRPADIEKLGYDLADMIRNTVRNHFGLALTPEV